MYALHPAVVHFPIALLLLNTALTLHYLRRPDPFTERAAYLMLLVGWWGALAATLTGTASAALAWPVRPEAVSWLNGHAVAGFGVLIVYGRALLWRRRKPDVLQGADSRRYVLLLLAGALLLGLDGWLGGHMVYRLGVGVELGSR